MNMIYGAFVVKIAGAARKRRKGQAWKSIRGLRPWQMYKWVSWKPGRCEVSFPTTDRIGIPVQKHPGTVRQGFPASSKPKGRHEKREAGEGIAIRQREEARRTSGSLSTLIVPLESRKTDPRKPGSREDSGGVSDYGVVAEKQTLHKEVR